MKNKNILSIAIVALVGLIVIIIVVENRNFHNEITANDVATSVEILQSSGGICSFTMYQGWNLVSFFCISSYASINQVLGPIDSTYEKVFYYDSSDLTDPWKSYNPSLPAGIVQQLTYFSRTRGYYIYMNAVSTYWLNGSTRASTIPLLPGWNLVGYPSNMSRTISESLNGTLFNVLKTYDNPTDSYLSYYQNWSNNTLNTTDTYKGYWINSTANQNWILNGT